MIGCGDRMQEAVIKSLINKDSNIATTIAQYGLRTVQKTRDASAATITCASGQDFWTLFNEALEVGTDGNIVLRIIIEAKQSGSGLSEVPDCGTYEDLWLMLAQCFAIDTNGDVAFVLWNIT